jgi:hypothetical protein
VLEVSAESFSHLSRHGADILVLRIVSHLP